MVGAPPKDLIVWLCKAFGFSVGNNLIFNVPVWQRRSIYMFFFVAVIIV